jgi:protease-4
MRRLVAVLFVALVVLALGYTLWGGRPGIPDSSVLVVELGGDLDEAPPSDTLGRLLATAPSLPTLLLQLEKASVDERIVGVLVHVRPLALGYARVQELRDAIARVRAAGKPVIAWLDVGTLNATRELYLGSAADRVYLTPGFLGPFVGLAGEYLHLGGLLEKLGIEVEYERIGRYKSAPEMFAAREMSEPAREVANELLDALFLQILNGVADGRKLSPTRVRELVDAGVSTGDEYLAAGLADGVAGREEALERAGLGDAEVIPVEDYARVAPGRLGLRRGPPIALVFGTGPILQTRRARSGLRAVFAADAVAEALRDAGEDPEVRAVVLRVDSGGGSVLGSDQVWRAVREVRQSKPLVVSMADVAASGAYYLASAADAIVAEPATLTGSIGVFFLRPVLAGLYERLEIGVEVIARGRHAAVVTSAAPLTAAQRERAQHFIRSLYEDFLERVSTGRDTPTEEIDRLGQGHVWLGETAHGHGLVDELGGLHAAIARAKREAGIPPDVDPQRRIFPGPRTLREQLREIGWGRALGGATLESLLPLRVPEALRAVWLLGEEELAYLPAWWLEIR